MKLRYAYKICLLLALVLTTVLIGCGRKARMADEQKVIWQDSPYETLWVEPQIVLADSLMTLIRSDRIDSVLADPSPSMPQPQTAIEIRIFQPSCNVSVGLFDADLRLVRPLLVRNLTTGFYRLTVNVDRFQKPALPPGKYYLKTDYCGEVQMALVTVE